MYRISKVMSSPSTESLSEESDTILKSRRERTSSQLQIGDAETRQAGADAMYLSQLNGYLGLSFV